MQKVSLLQDWARVGKFLVREKKITMRQLKTALSKQHAGKGGRVGEICVELGFCTIEDVEHAIACRSASMLERKSITAPAMQAFRDEIKRIKVVTSEYTAAEGIHS